MSPGRAQSRPVFESFTIPAKLGTVKFGFDPRPGVDVGFIVLVSFFDQLDSGNFGLGRVAPRPGSFCLYQVALVSWVGGFASNEKHDGVFPI